MLLYFQPFSLQAGEGKVTASHFLYTHLQFIRHTITMARNTELLASMKAQLEGKAKAEEGKKTVKAQDVVRMYENMIQNLLEVPTLPGLEDDEELAASTKAKVDLLLLNPFPGKNLPGDRLQGLPILLHRPSVYLKPEVGRGNGSIPAVSQVFGRGNAPAIITGLTYGPGVSGQKGAIARREFGQGVGAS